MALKMGYLLAAFALFSIRGLEGFPPAQDDVSAIAEEPLTIRLPTNLEPSHYLVQLQPFVNSDFRILGHIEISFKVLTATNRIVLHMKDIITKNDTVKVYLEGSPQDTTIVVQNQAYDPEKQYYIATLNVDLDVEATYVISMDYVGYLNDQLKGFYRSSYKTEDGDTRFLATTQFQATDARRAFPCFDEPALKARFTIEIIREELMMAVSNMPLLSSKQVDDQPGWVLDHFETSFPMSTYLVAFIVSDFEHRSSEEVRNYQFGVLTRKEVIHQANYALEVGPKMMDFFEEFFEVPYPLPKLDMAAVPDFSAGAMENWGLVIYREAIFVYNKELTDANTKRRISTVISHELAHQWFGDIVTPSWWTDLWLNEGFASYVEYLGMNAVDPTLKYLDQVVAVDVHRALERDCIETSHPISVPVEHPDEINEIFDAISYQKGASVIRMMSFFLTEGTFRKALKNYLTHFSFKSAEQDDLWEFMTNQAHEDGTLQIAITVKEIMDTWTLQMGYPVVTVKRNMDGTALLKQERFLIAENSISTHDYKWWIPITFTTDVDPDFNQTVPSDWMMPSESEKTIQNISLDHKWVIFNLKESGYYRVNYDPENWKALAEQLTNEAGVIESVNRAQIIDDSLNLARAGRLSYDIALEILSYIKTESDYVPLYAALNNVGYLKHMFASFDESTLLKNFILSILVPLYDEVGFEDSTSDHELEQLKRIEVLSLACELGHQPCINSATNLYSRWMEDPENMRIISPNLKTVVYCTSIAEGGQREWDFAYDRYVEIDNAAEKNLILSALACSKNTDTLKSYIESSIVADQGIRKQDAKTVIAAVATNDIGRPIAWQFLREKWGDITSYYGSVSFSLTSIVEAITKYLNTQENLDEMESYQEEYDGKFLSATRAVEQGEENIRNNIQWKEKSYTAIVQWLRDNGFEESL